MTEQRASLTEEYIGYPGCTCVPDVNIWGDDVCEVCKELRDDYYESEANVRYCKVCDGGHDGGEFGELCPANGPRWFEPSDPRDLNDQFELSASGNQRTPEDWF